MKLKKSVLVFIIVLLITFLLCIPVVCEWTVFELLFSGYAKGFLIVVIARKIADWIMGDKCET